MFCDTVPLAKSLTIRHVLAHAVSRLAEDPILRRDSSRDASLLLVDLLRITRAQLHADPDRALTPAQAEEYGGLIARRLRYEPIQYITGEQEFFGLTLSVSPAVLIPRPETEHVVESVLSELDSSKPLRIADIGTGSGAIAIALAHHLPLAFVTATDISVAALEIAKENARRNNVLERIEFLNSDLLEAVLPSIRDGTRGEFDAVVSNPPYVAETDVASLHPQIREYEPVTALFAGGGGLDIYRALIPQAHAALKGGGLLALEIGEGQHDDLTALLRGWQRVRFVADLQQILRVALAGKA